MNARLLQCSFILLALASVAAAQRQPEPARNAADAKEPAVQTMVYDIRDLLKSNAAARTSTLVPPNRIGLAKPALPGQMEGGGIGGGPGAAEKPKPADTDPADEMTKLIIDTVEPNSWRDSGGSIGVLRMVHGMMIVSQTQENHKAIQSILSQLREEMSHMITIVARWVVLDSGQLDQLAQPLKMADGSALQTINLAALDKLPGGAVKYRGQITCFNGQTVELSSGRARTTITGLIAVVGQGAAGYQPEASVVEDGVSLQLTPTLPPQSTTATIDIESVISEWGGLQPSPLAPTTQPTNMDAPATLDRVDIQVQQLQTTIVVPVGKPIIVGGLSLPSRAEKDSAGRQMYLVIEVLAAK